MRQGALVDDEVVKEEIKTGMSAPPIHISHNLRLGILVHGLPPRALGLRWAGLVDSGASDQIRSN